MSEPMDLANKTASLFFRQSDERPLKDSGLKREDDRKILSYEISEAIASERRRLIERFRPVVEALQKIHEQWFDPTDGIGGACVADCDAGLPDKTPHRDHCPFKIAHDSLMLWDEIEKEI